MITFSDIQNTIYKYFDDNWTGSLLTYENTPWKPPVEDPWIRVTVRPFSSDNMGLGTQCVKISGQIIVQIFIRYDRGTGDAFSLADQVKELLENKILDTCIYTYESSLRIIEDSQRQLNHIQSDWYQVNVHTLFETAC